MELTDKSQLIKYLKQHGLWVKKSLGQNFLVDDGVLAKIVAAADIKSNDTIVEIGPGLGVLTQELAKRAGKVIAIEKDDLLAQVLNDKIRMSNIKSNSKSQITKVKIINADALKINIDEILRVAQDDKGGAQNDKLNYKVVANIPYNITSAIIRKFLAAENKPELMVLLVQKEVAERICAQAGEMSLLSVSVQFYAEAEIIGIVKNTSFFPVPKVDSAIIKLKAKSQKSKVKSKEFFRIVKFGFASRRKTLANNLSAGVGISKAAVSDIIKKAGLKEKVRAQELNISDWIKLSEE